MEFTYTDTDDPLAVPNKPPSKIPTPYRQAHNQMKVRCLHVISIFRQTQMQWRSSVDTCQPMPRLITEGGQGVALAYRETAMKAPVDCITKTGSIIQSILNAFRSSNAAYLLKYHQVSTTVPPQEQQKRLPSWQNIHQHRKLVLPTGMGMAHLSCKL
jgi:hypothetical protein